VLRYCDGIQSIAALHQLPLQHLDLNGCRSITALSTTSDTHSKLRLTLKHLTLKGLQLTELTSLQGFVALENLDLTGCRYISDLAPLRSAMNSLQCLNISRCEKIKDLTPLSELQKLRTLTINGSLGVTDFSPLGGNLYLEALDVAGIKNLHGEAVTINAAQIAKIKNLKVLNLSSCTNIIAPEQFVHCKHLHRLILTSCRLSLDFSIFAQHSDLQITDHNGKVFVCGQSSPS